MKSNFELVKQFHDSFNKIKDPDTPQSIIAQHELRQKLITEEYREVLEEMGYSLKINMDHHGEYKVDIVKLSKELADLLYVVYGTAATYGIPIDEVYREVHRSNMSKLGIDGKPIYREDGKVLKGPNYTPANIEKILNEKKV
jgi:predicted HAD superfamily Cof-like phosphohydrolase